MPRSDRMSLEEYLANSKSIQSNKVRLKLLQDGYKEYKCERCGRKTWLGEPIPLELHHIDGNKKNNKVSNLQIIDGRYNLSIGCISKAIQRRLPAQTYYYKDYIIVSNKMLDGDKSNFNHYVSDPKNKTIKYHFTTKYRVLYEELIQTLKDEGVI